MKEAIEILCFGQSTNLLRILEVCCPISPKESIENQQKSAKSGFHDGHLITSNIF